MRYREYLKKTKASTDEKAIHMKQQFVAVFFRQLGFYIAPFFLMINVSANKITLFGLILGLIASGMIWQGNVIFGIVVYFLVVLLDHVDGTVARVNNEATFFGRFVDGFVGIIVGTAIKLSLTVLSVNTHGLDEIAWFGIFATLLTPMHYMFYDRYSSFARWINEENPNSSIKPYLRDKMPLFFNKINDLQNILLLSLPVYYYIQDINSFFILLYFVCNIYLALHTLYSYTMAAYKNFFVPARPHR